VVLVGLEALGASSLILLLAAVGALTALVFQWGTADGMARLRRVYTTTLVVLIALTVPSELFSRWAYF
jgi:hypothetical protein